VGELQAVSQVQLFLNYQMLKRRIIVAKNGIRVFILWILGHVISFAIYPLTGFATAVRDLVCTPDSD
jgi:hypothetical protein